MIRVDMPCDVDKVKTKVVMGLTKRQAIGFGISGLLGLPLYWFLNSYVSSQIAIYGVIFVAFPILFFTFYEKNGLFAETIIKHMYMHRKYNPMIRKKEVKNIEGKREKKQGNKK